MKARRYQLRKEAVRKSASHPLWQHVQQGFNTGLDSNISRLSSISKGTGTNQTTVAAFTYMGDGTVVKQTDQNGVSLNHIGAAGAVGAGGDQYVGLDRFGQVVKENWTSALTTTSIDQYEYVYDADGRVGYKQYADGSRDVYNYTQLGLSSVTKGVNTTKAGSGVTITPTYDLSE